MLPFLRTKLRLCNSKFKIEEGIVKTRPAKDVPRSDHDGLVEALASANLRLEDMTKWENGMPDSGPVFEAHTAMTAQAALIASYITNVLSVMDNHKEKALNKESQAAENMPPRSATKEITGGR